MATTKSYRITSIQTYNGSQDTIDQLNEANITILELESTITDMINGNVTEVPNQSQPMNIRPSAFEDCTDLTEFTGNIQSLGRAAFKNCSSLERITSVNTDIIPEECFLGCSNLVSIGSTSFTTVRAAAFSGCYDLTGSVSVSGNIYENAFRNCNSLTGADIYRLQGSYAFENCTSLASVSISGGDIYYGTFKGCTSLSSIDGMEYVTGIGAYAFQNCTSLTSITIPDITSISDSAFTGCTSLNNITYLGSVDNAPARFRSISRDVPATVIHCSDGDWTITRIGD